MNENDLEPGIEEFFEKDATPKSDTEDPLPIHVIPDELKCARKYIYTSSIQSKRTPRNRMAQTRWNMNAYNKHFKNWILPTISPRQNHTGLSSKENKK